MSKEYNNTDKQMALIDVQGKNISKLFKTLKERLEDIHISNSEKIKTSIEEGIKTGRKAIVAAIPGSGTIDALLNYEEGIKENIEKKKLEILLGSYLNKFDNLEIANSKLLDLLHDPHGYFLYNKIRRISDEKSPTPEYVTILGQALGHITNHEFKTKFSDHSTILEIISRLSPGALLILRNVREWPLFTYHGMSVAGEPVEPAWVEGLSESYGEKKGLKDVLQTWYIYSSFLELFNEKIIQRRYDGKTSKHAGRLTLLGIELFNYISDEPLSEIGVLKKIF